MITHNISRDTARKWNTPLDPDKHCWISIGEPSTPTFKINCNVSNPILNSVNHLKIDFWDITTPTENQYGGNEMLYPATEEDARKIVEFLHQNKGKVVINQCRAGISRSGAISRFCHEYLGYEWDKDSIKRAVPNDHIFWLLVKAHNVPKPTKIIDKRRITL